MSDTLIVRESGREEAAPAPSFPLSERRDLESVNDDNPLAAEIERLGDERADAIRRRAVAEAELKPLVQLARKNGLSLTVIAQLIGGISPQAVSKWDPNNKSDRTE